MSVQLCVVALVFVISCGLGAVPPASRPDTWNYRLRSRGLLPNWRLFAPDPISFRICLLVNEAHGSEVARVGPSPRVSGIGFDPHHRRLKAVERASAALLTLSDPAVAVRTSAYGELLIAAAEAAVGSGHGGGVPLQFQLERSVRDAEARVVFSSAGFVVSPQQLEVKGRSD